MTTSTMTTNERFRAETDAIQTEIKAGKDYEWQQAWKKLGKRIDRFGGARVLYALDEADGPVYPDDRKPHRSEVARELFNRSEEIVDLLHWHAGEVLQVSSTAPSIIRDHALTIEELDLFAVMQVNIEGIPCNETAPRVLAHHLRAIAQKCVESADRLDAVADKIGVAPATDASIAQQRPKLMRESELKAELAKLSSSGEGDGLRRDQVLMAEVSRLRRETARIESELERLKTEVTEAAPEVANTAEG